MTRTERSQAPAALLKDRHSRTGLTKTEQGHKHGAGVHNWGSFTEEGRLESQGASDAAMDNLFDDGADNEADDSNVDEGEADDDNDSVGELGRGLGVTQRVAAGEADMMAAPKDAKASPADDASDAAHSPTDARPVPGRRMSSFTPEEWEQAKLFRERGIRKDSKDLDLAHIARTSYGVSQSPPSVGAFATSPTKIKNGFVLQ
ncbi:hypothetical protein Q5752_005329 [Cryptotrichosporon argae]